MTILIYWTLQTMKLQQKNYGRIAVLRRDMEKPNLLIEHKQKNYGADPVNVHLLNTNVLVVRETIRLLDDNLNVPARQEKDLMCWRSTVISLQKKTAREMVSYR